MTPITLFPQYILDNYEVEERHHAAAILSEDFKQEWAEIINALTGFELWRSEIEMPGGNFSKIAFRLHNAFVKQAWTKKTFITRYTVNTTELDSATHEVDFYKNRIAVEVEWNSKDSVFVRDLNNFRLLYDIGVISVGIIITRCDELQAIFDNLPDPKEPGKTLGRKYGASTTHMSKLLDRLNTGGGGGCPILAFGIKKSLYRPNL